MAKTQKELVYDFLKENGSISSAQAFLELSIMDLPKRICELKEQGHKFNCRTVSGKNKRGVITHWNVYSLNEGGAENDSFSAM